MGPLDHCRSPNPAIWAKMDEIGQIKKLSLKVIELLGKGLLQTRLPRLVFMVIQFIVRFQLTIV